MILLVCESNKTIATGRSRDGSVIILAGLQERKRAWNSNTKTYSSMSDSGHRRKSIVCWMLTRMSHRTLSIGTNKRPCTWLALSEYLGIEYLAMLHIAGDSSAVSGLVVPTFAVSEFEDLPEITTLNLLYYPSLHPSRSPCTRQGAFFNTPHWTRGDRHGCELEY